MNLVDTHCHLHPSPLYMKSGEGQVPNVIKNAIQAGVTKMITVGTDVEDSRKAIEFARQHEGVFALAGIHPNIDEEQDLDEFEKLLATGHVVGLGDVGLDYHYEHDKEKQIKLLESLLGLAVKYDFPVSFHVREAFDDFWSVFDSFKGLRGVLHCYTDDVDNMEKGLERGLYISINGIATFNHEPQLEEVFARLPIDRVLLETDAPYLAPKPHRGKNNEPAYIRDICEAWAKSHGMAVDEVAEVTTKNAEELFGLTG